MEDSGEQSRAGDDPLAASRTSHHPPMNARRKVIRRVIVLTMTLALMLVGTVLYLAAHRAIAGANRVCSASNLKQIGLAMIMYANDHHGEFPDSMETILATTDITLPTFVYPGGNDIPPSGATTQAVLIDLTKRGHCSYLYFGGGLSSACEPSAVLACERAMPETRDGMNVLMGDGHIEFIAEPAATQLRAALASGPACWTASGGVSRPTTAPSVTR
jgi:prepilin-type processing-associated H-X9-DG protein